MLTNVSNLDPNRPLSASVSSLIERPADAPNVRTALLPLPTRRLFCCSNCSINRQLPKLLRYTTQLTLMLFAYITALIGIVGATNSDNGISIYIWGMFGLSFISALLFLFTIRKSCCLARVTEETV